MVYITKMQSPQYHQMSVEELLFHPEKAYEEVTPNKDFNTRTDKLIFAPPDLVRRSNIPGMVKRLREFNDLTAMIRMADRLEYYTNFYRQKRDKGYHALFRAMFKSQNRYVQCDSGKVCRGVSEILQMLFRQHPAKEHGALFEACKKRFLDYLSGEGFDASRLDFDSLISDNFRRIDAPTGALKMSLSMLKQMFENEFGALYHTSAFAYIKGRSTVKCMQRHQQNNSRWYAKFDLSNFFGSTTPEFVMKMLSMIFPFSEIVKENNGQYELETALSLGFLNGGLPQGTPLSPTLTNIMMIPIDFQISNTLRNYEKQRYVYTRYADDFQISSEYDFKLKEIENLIIDVMASFDAPFTVNVTKTRYGSRSGSNWNLGVMINKDNEMTLGYKRKRQLLAAVSSYAMDKKNGAVWDRGELQSLCGNINYARMINKQWIDGPMQHLCDRFKMDIPREMKRDLSA